MAIVNRICFIAQHTPIEDEPAVETESKARFGLNVVRITTGFWIAKATMDCTVMVVMVILHASKISKEVVSMMDDNGVMNPG